MREAIHEMLDFVDDVLDDLHSRHEINYLRALLENPAGTGADRQLAIHRQTNDPHAVTQYLLQTAMNDITSSSVR
jgi:carboxylate-amine ligase